MTEKERFLVRFEEAKKKGLVDVKFLVRHGSSLSEDDFYSAANRMEDSIDANDCRRHTSWDKDVTPTRSVLLA